MDHNSLQRGSSVLSTEMAAMIPQAQAASVPVKQNLCGGFTLIELLVVIVIIAILAAARARAHTTFSKITSGDIVTDVGFSAGCAWGDYNNDGYLDFFVGNQQGNENYLYL